MATERVVGSAGDQDDLARVLGNPLYAPLVDHVDARRGEAVRIEGSARLEVTTVGEAGEETRYLFSLARAPRGEQVRWRVTGLVRAERADA